MAQISLTFCATSVFWIALSYFYPAFRNSPKLIENTTPYKYFYNDSILTAEEFFQQVMSEKTDLVCWKKTVDNILTNHTNQIGNLTSDVCGLHEEVEGVKSVQNTLKQKLNKAEKSIENLNVKLNHCKRSKWQMEAKITKMAIKLDRQESIVDGDRGIQEYSDHTKADKGITFVVAIILAIGELCIFVALCTKGAKQVQALGETAENNYPAGDEKVSNGTKSVLDDIHREADLESSLCIVSFNDSTQTKHYQMVNSFIDPKIEKKSFLVNGHEDLRDIPASKIYMVFVDYNARNIILESERELGDLRKTTVQAIWKIGATVVLVYCGDEYSQVTDNALYNHRLTSIKKHEELKQLETKQCVLSVKDNAFSDFQKKHLKDLIQRLFNQ